MNGAERAMTELGFVGRLLLNEKFPPFCLPAPLSFLRFSQTRLKRISFLGGNKERHFSLD